MDWLLPEPMGWLRLRSRKRAERGKVGAVRGKILGKSVALEWIFHAIAALPGGDRMLFGEKGRLK